MSESTPPSRHRRLAPAASILALTTLLVAACGGGTTSSSAPGSSEASAAAPTDAVTDAATAPSPVAATGGSDASAGAPAGQATLATLVSTDAIAAALGETPSPECDTSVLTGAGTCVWKAADGSWLKLEDGESRETPDLASFTDRMTKTLGLDQAVDGLGEAAYLGSSSRGTRISVFLGKGRVFWVVLNKAGDPAAQASQVTDIATKVLAAL